MKKQNIKYLNLIKELALTDFKLKYQGSFLGYLWSLVKPLMLFTVLYIVFTKFLKLGGSIEHYPVYLLLGVVMWGFFVEITAGSLDAIVSKGELIRKVYFPRIVLVVARGTTSLLTFSLNFIAVLLFISLSGIVIGFKSVLLPLVILELFVLSIGLSLIISALFVKFRDIAHIWEVVLQALFYSTPILYPLSLVPDKIGKILILNPVAQIIQDARYLLITDKAETAWKILDSRFFWIPYVLSLIIFIVGLYVFNRSAAKFAEEV